MLLGGGGEELLVFKSCAASGGGRGVVVRMLGRAGAQTYLGPRTRSGDMMRMGCPARGLVRVAAAQSFQDVHPGDGWRQFELGSESQASGDW